MPRKIKLCWGDDGFHDTEPLTLTIDQAVELGALLGVECAPRKVRVIRAKLEEIGSCFRNWYKRGPTAFSRAQAYNALEELLKLERIDYAVLTSLNGRAFDAFLDALHTMNSATIAPGETIYSALIGNRLSESNLRAAMQNATEELKSNTARDPAVEVPWAVAELCQLYEELTGTKATHSNKGKDLGYRQEPQSKAGGFVQHCFRLIDSSILPSQISLGMRHFIESRG